MERHITLPLTREEARTIKSGEQLLLSGVIYTARDAAHKRLCELVEKGEPLPFDVKNATIYYVGPTPAKPGQVIGSAGPTTSYRMDGVFADAYPRGRNGHDRQRQAQCGGHRCNEKIRCGLFCRNRRRRCAAFKLHQKGGDNCIRGSRRGGSPKA